MHIVVTKVTIIWYLAKSLFPMKIKWKSRRSKSVNALTETLGRLAAVLADEGTWLRHPRLHLIQPPLFPGTPRSSRNPECGDCSASFFSSLLQLTNWQLIDGYLFTPTKEEITITKAMYSKRLQRKLHVAKIPLHSVHTMTGQKKKFPFCHFCCTVDLPFSANCKKSLTASLNAAA